MARVRARFGEAVAVFHSSLGQGERFDEWWRVKRGEARVVVGARSALFVPLANPGLIILDEEHEYTYKQEETPRYHARDVAREICQRVNGLLLLGSATPSLESYRAAETGELTRIPLPRRVLGDRFRRSSWLTCGRSLRPAVFHPLPGFAGSHRLLPGAGEQVILL